MINTTIRLFLLLSFPLFATAPKKVILFIGDGMGMAQVQVAEAWLQYKTKNPDTSLFMTRLGLLSMVETKSHSGPITGSAAAATALSSGQKTDNGMVGILPDKKTQAKSIADHFHEAGRKVGIVSSVSLDHATPACFYAHQLSRNSYADIALQAPASGFEFFGGGFFKSSMSDSSFASTLTASFQKEGYRIIRPASTQPSHVEIMAPGPVLVSSADVDGSGSLPGPMDMPPLHWTLADFTRAAIQKLDKPEGFFLMVEGGRIDWAGHENDLKQNILETLEFDRAIAEAVKYSADKKDVLILVTADHETGGLALGSDALPYRHDLSKLEIQTRPKWFLIQKISEVLTKKSDEEFEKILAVLKTILGLGDSDKGLYLDKNNLADLRLAQNTITDRATKLSTAALRLIAAKAGFTWSTGNHTAVRVPLFGQGAGSTAFRDMRDNTEIPKIIMKGL